MVKWLEPSILNHKLLLSLVKRIPQRSKLGGLPQILLQKSSQRSSMASGMSVLGGSQLDSLCIYSLARKKDNMLTLASKNDWMLMTAVGSFNLSSDCIDCSRMASGGLKIGRKCGGVLPRLVLHDATLYKSEWNYCRKPRCKDFHASNSSSFSAGLPVDVSLDEIVNKEQLEYPTTSSDSTIERKPLKLNSGSCYLPHPDKEKTGGEDAHFICDNEQSIGVADGVGGWAELGINAGVYAQQLMSHSAAAIQHEPEGSIDPMRVLGKAYSLTKVLGSSTACIIALTELGICAANLGDSGFIIVRDDSTIFQSPSQQHGFNFPYQLEYGDNADHPNSAQVFTVDVAAGDVVVAGTDGLFDNLFDEEIASVVKDAVVSGLSPNETAKNIATLAQLRAMDKERQTPFSAAAKQVGIPFYGGKLDDITVVVSYIS